MNVKAQGLLNAAKYIEEKDGRDVLAEIIRGCSAALRETYTGAMAINWHPVAELCEFCEAAEKRIGRSKLVEEIGAAGARANMKGLLLRLAFYWAKPEYLMKRAAALYRQFNDEGTMELIEFSPKIVRLEVKGVRAPSATFCRILTGWCAETAKALGVRQVIANHVQCRAHGDARCIYEVRGRYEAPPESPPIT